MNRAQADSRKADSCGVATRPAIDFMATFDSPVIPQVGLTGRAVQFQTGPGTAASYCWIDGSQVPIEIGLTTLRQSFPEISSVSLRPGLVTIELASPHLWDSTLFEILSVVTETFVQKREPLAPNRNAERANREFTGLDPTSPRGQVRVRDALTSLDPAIRQIAISLIGESDIHAAAKAWRIAIDDSSRDVRRAAIIGAANSGLEELRPLLERALTLSDACARFVAVTGLDRIGAQRSKSALEPITRDQDARVRVIARLVLSGKRLGR